MTERTNVEFAVEGGATLRGWLSLTLWRFEVGCELGDPVPYAGNSMARENRKSKVFKGNTQPEETPSFGHLSCRWFLSRLGPTGAAAAASPLLGVAQTQFKQEHCAHYRPTYL
jgi:hypothetical protein